MDLASEAELDRQPLADVPGVLGEQARREEGVVQLSTGGFGSGSAVGVPLVEGVCSEVEADDEVVRAQAEEPRGLRVGRRLRPLEPVAWELGAPVEPRCALLERERGPVREGVVEPAPRRQADALGPLGVARRPVVDDGHVAALAVLGGPRDPEPRRRPLGRVEEGPGGEREPPRPGDVGERVAVAVIGAAPVRRREDGVAQAPDAVGQKRPGVEPARARGVEEDGPLGGRGLRAGRLRDEVDEPRDGVAAVERGRRALDYLNLAQVERRDLQERQPAREPAVEREAVLQELGVAAVEPLDADRGVPRHGRRLLNDDPRRLVEEHRDVRGLHRDLLVDLLARDGLDARGNLGDGSARPSRAHDDVAEGILVLFECDLDGGGGASRGTVTATRAVS